MQRDPSEEVIPEGLITPMRNTQDLCKFRFFAKRFQQRICRKRGVGEKPSFDTTTQDAKRGCSIAERGVALGDLIDSFRVADTALRDFRLQHMQWQNG